MKTKILVLLTTLAALLLGVLASPASASQARETKEPVTQAVQVAGETQQLSVISEANGWKHVSAEQNLKDQAAQRAADRFMLRKSPYNGCPDYKVCLWQWINFGGDRWESTLTNLWNSGCISLNNPVAYWDNGTLVNDNSGSMGFNNSGGAWGNYRAYLYNWAYCNGGGGVTSEALGPGGAIYGGSLHGGHWWYHKITSLDLTYVG